MTSTQTIKGHEWLEREVKRAIYKQKKELEALPWYKRLFRKPYPAYCWRFSIALFEIERLALPKDYSTYSPTPFEND